MYNDLSRLEEAAAGGEESFESFILANGSGTSEERRRAAECARMRCDVGLAREIECVYVGEDVRVLRAARLRDEGVLRGLVGGTWRGVMDLCADELGRDVPVLVKGAGDGETRGVGGGGSGGGRGRGRLEGRLGM